MSSSTPDRLPPMGAAMLLRALLKRPSRQASELRTDYLAEPIDPHHLARYRDAIGFAGDGVPLTYHYLAVQRAHLASMLCPGFPFRIAGMVHVANELETLAPFAPGDPRRLRTSIHIEDATERGARYCDCITEVLQRDVVVLRCASRYLAVRGRAREGGPARAQPVLPDMQAGAWRIAQNAGRRYAALSGDWNPIHLWPWTARLMGLDQPIIHGMHTLAAACAALERTAGTPLRAMHARFRAPVPLPAELAIYMQAGTGIFAVVSGGLLAVEGDFRL